MSRPYLNERNFHIKTSRVGNVYNDQFVVNEIVLSNFVFVHFM